MKLTSVLVHLYQLGDSDNCNTDMIAKYRIAIAILVTVATSGLADDVERRALEAGARAFLHATPSSCRVLYLKKIAC